MSKKNKVDIVISCIRQRISIIITVMLILWVYKNWFISPVSTGGDFNFAAYPVKDIIRTHPYVWDASLNNGLGQYVLFTLPSFWFFYVLTNIFSFVTSTSLFQKLVFLYPVLVLGFISIKYLIQKITSNALAQSAAILTYLINPYILMLTSGGQIGVALAYAIAPLLVGYVVQEYLNKELLRKISTSKTINKALIMGLLVALIVSLDSRIALLTLLIILPLYLSVIKSLANTYAQIKYALISAGIILGTVLSIHAYWILPAILVQSVALPRGYDNVASLEFFSFARLAHAITLSHPNYPLNIFGVVREVKGWEFIFPILAFLALKTKRIAAYFFSLLALIGIFLAKGANAPFAFIYEFLFMYVPTGSWFRDSTKFFLYISLGYSVLLAITAQYIYSSIKNNISRLLIAIVCVCAIARSWYPAFSNHIYGTLKNQTLPDTYIQFNRTLQNDKSYGRVLWIPARDEFGLANALHPAVNLSDLVRSPNCVPQLCVEFPQVSDPSKFNRKNLTDELQLQTQWLYSDNAQQLLQSLAISYIVVVPDFAQTRYIFDRKFDPSIRLEFEERIQNLPYSINLYSDNGLSAWKVKDPGYFVSDHNNKELLYKEESPTKILISWPGGKGQIKVAQTFDSRWALTDGKVSVKPIEDKHKIITVFNVTNDQEKLYYLEFEPQSVATIGFQISKITIIAIILYGAIIIKNKYSRKTSRQV